MERRVYIQPKVNQSTIPQNVEVPFCNKISAFRNFIETSLTVCTSDRLTSELYEIRDIAKTMDIKKRNKHYYCFNSEHG